MAEETQSYTLSVSIDDGDPLEFGYYAEDALAVAAYAGDESYSLEAVLNDVADACADVFGINDLGFVEDLVALIPDGVTITITLRQLVFAYLPGDEPNYLFSFSLGTGIDLSALSPVLAQALSGDELLGVDDLLVYVTTQPWTSAQMTSLNEALSTLNAVLADEGSELEFSNLPVRDLDSGLGFGYTLTLAGQQYRFGLPIDGSSETTYDENGQPTEPEDDEPDAGKLTLVTEASTYTLWYDLQQSFGAAEFERLGLRYSAADNVLAFVLDAALKTGSVELSLQDLAFGGTLDTFEAEFSLGGIGLEYSTSALSMNGQFLEASNGDYQGAVIVTTKTFTLATLAAFQPTASPSLFIYGFLDKPLGGPAFFFVEGLAAGIGYNRALTTPAIEDIPDFPLVSVAITPPEDLDIDALTDMMAALEEYCTPAAGSQFYAFGVKFNTFKIIDSFALFLALIEGDAWKIRMLGYSTLTAPVPKGEDDSDPLAYLELALDGVIDPSDGSMGIQGQLTDNSFVFSKDCLVTGGFAFYAWFSGDHEGDFVQTIGGYHPDFSVPAHYPTVPRLALDWRISSSISVEGELYFALTPRMLMAGGYLKATWSESGISAWFKTTADFLLSWKPYYYSIRLRVEVGASAKIKVNLGFAKVHKKITVHVGAQLDLWGPEFSGKAKIKCSLLSFTIRFGSGSAKLQPMGWSEFSKSFLPAAGSVCSIQPTGGVQATVGDWWVIAARDLCLLVDTIVPANEARLMIGSDEGQALTYESGSDFLGVVPTFGISPMDVSPADNIASTLELSVKDGDGHYVTTDFEITARFKNMPGGVWGTTFSPSLNDASTIEQAFSGFTIKPATSAKASETVAIDEAELSAESTLLEGVFGWDDAELPAVTDGEDENAREATMEDSLAAGFDVDTFVSGIFDDLEPVDRTSAPFTVSTYRVIPQIEMSEAAA